LLADLLPGFSFHQQQTHSCWESGRCWYDVTEDVLHELQGKLVAVRSHPDASPACSSLLHKEIGRYMVLLRDVRDVLVSCYFHILTNPNSALVNSGCRRLLPWAPVSPDVLNLDRESSFDLLIEQLLPGVVTLSEGWLDIQRGSDKVLLLRYEEVTTQPLHEVMRIMNFYNIDMPESLIASKLQASRVRSPTPGMYKFRKGQIGNWKTVLTQHQQIRCEEIAGEFLRKMGYPLRSA
jgi:hypothetical protein